MLKSGIHTLTVTPKEELMTSAKNLQAPFDLVQYVASHGKLPVPNFSAGGVATPADAALMRLLGAESVFVGSGIFKSSDPAKVAKAVVEATTFFNDPDKLAVISEGLGEAMRGLDIRQIDEKDLMALRGW
jgi:pyridoxal 5'-phosphate synthase pdxS subunit